MPSQPANRPKPTRLDFIVAGDQVVVNKVLEGVLPNSRDIVMDTDTKKHDELDTMLEWCESHGWVVRRFLPAGARAWKGAQPRPVRSKTRILKLAQQLQRQGIDSNRYDLRYDM